MSNLSKLKILCNFIVDNLSISIQFSNTIEESIWWKKYGEQSMEMVIPIFNDEFGLPNFVWDDDELGISCARMICHELGHYLMATPKRRWKKDFAINNSRTDYYQLEEDKAFVIEIKLLHHFGFIKRSHAKNCRFEFRSFSRELRVWWKKVGFDLTDEFIKDPKKFDLIKEK